MIGYLILSTFLLYSFMGGTLWLVAIDRYSLNVDLITFVITLLNFAVLGVVSMFVNKPDITPPGFAQFYAIAGAVLLAWQFSHFEDWTGWSLLVMLGLYDLCAVLTPCGPLKALVGLMIKKEEGGEDGNLPGLLYEAKVPVRRGKPRARTAEPGELRPLPIHFSLALALRYPVLNPSDVPEKALGAEYTLSDRMKIVDCKRPQHTKFAKKEDDDGCIRYFIHEEEENRASTYVVDPSREGRVFLEETVEEDEEGGKIKVSIWSEDSK